MAESSADKAKTIVSKDSKAGRIWWAQCSHHHNVCDWRRVSGCGRAMREENGWRGWHTQISSPNEAVHLHDMTICMMMMMGTRTLKWMSLISDGTFAGWRKRRIIAFNENNSHHPLTLADEFQQLLHLTANVDERLIFIQHRGCHCTGRLSCELEWEESTLGIGKWREYNSLTSMILILLHLNSKAKALNEERA